MESASCPGCGWRSSRVHYYYQRSLADRPVADRQVRLDLRARRLVCGNDSCGRRTFAEQIPDQTRRHARRTNALTSQLTDIALFLGGRAGTSSYRRLAVTIGKDTLLRLLRALPVVRVVCRDRAGSFPDGAHAGAPQARQVADAWHLLHSLAEAVERVVGRHRADLREPLTVQAGQDDVRPTTLGELDVHGRSPVGGLGRTGLNTVSERKPCKSGRRR
ncbi:transposase family protein [Streptomyces sp. NPDC050988]|uniref:transposase family protein n=1 Tax=Streptomyces sp. NPDC050988 TaxID=3365637 RepID=UPI00379F1808